ncbi:MAG: 2,3,4,5-tetrahydropyridine-2,6-dicarboxylate N-succinyltransferase [Bacteroidota bacterium]|nr:2,3,4,5-tetrahydropyridine-2,6-dicarboxylate N-succinyltransferase [Bacteroidota bacterium]
MTCRTNGSIPMKEIITRLLQSDPVHATAEDFELLHDVWRALREGVIRAAHKVDGDWIADIEVKQVILWAFRSGVLEDVPGDATFHFTDKHTLPVQRFGAASGRRIVPGGTTVRDGAYVASGVIVMPPAYINVGAYVDEQTLVDSHALVGSCAQIGKRVHLSAGVQIGGVLEPIGAVPVVVEDDVMVGGNSGIYEGTVVRRRAVIGTGVILNASTPVYDCVHGRILRREAGRPLEIPENAVVVAGSRPARGAFATAEKLQMYTPLIIKYRDERTDAATALEESLR